MQLTTNCLSTTSSRQSVLFQHHPIDPRLFLSVIVPARNEADNLERSLHALRNQQQANGLPLPSGLYEVLLLLNNCTDDSASVATAYQQRYPAFPLRIAAIQLPAETANIGTVRRLLMDAAYERLIKVGKPSGIIASTDGDTVVDSQWVYQIMQETQSGCEVVGGRILTQADGNSVRRNHLRDVTYRMLVAQVEACLDPQTYDPWPRHFQHFGASLALTCEAYKRVGGLPNVPYLEDEALYRALVRTDTRIRKSPHVRVTTSTRMHGQATVGFSEQLRYWAALNRANKCQLAEPAGAVIRRFRSRSQLRSVWQNRFGLVNLDLLIPIATDLLIDLDWLRNELLCNRYFGQLWENIEAKMATGKWAVKWQPAPITETISELRLFLRTINSNGNPLR
ncbi:glycosyltransferase [Spirosoma validum]|uniref:Glycosyltransferase n=1 Tax=Spirosoma validum TaxID=2771355 RepID=A0A927GH19_9BACT|nr:glycosyltransferase [Spirosoma validum]MBD2757210.1 glycosyltransferase [Spirosoma validum]